MPYLDSKSDFDRIEELFDGVWESSVLRISLLDLDSSYEIPNGELVLSREPLLETEDTLYQEGSLTIHEIVNPDPFELLNNLLNGEIQTTHGSVEVDLDFYEHTPAETFSGGARSDVREARPREEFNAILEPNLPEEILEEYASEADELEDQLHRSEEPYYDVSRAENYYFKYRFGSDRERPRILVFANPGINIQVDEEAELTLHFPEVLTDYISISVMPQRPYGEFKGWSIDVGEGAVIEDVDDRCEFSTKLELEGVERTYIRLFVGDELVRHVDHRLPPRSVENDRFRVLDEYDQNGHLDDYLAGVKPNQFEQAVLNVLSTAGYLVQWYGGSSFKIPNWSDDVRGPEYNEIDLIAYAPDGSEILFVECTNRELSAKEQVIDRAKEISPVLTKEFIESEVGLQKVQLRPCIAISRSQEEISDDVQTELENRGVKILYRERILAILDASRDDDGTTSIDTEYIDVI